MNAIKDLDRLFDNRIRLGIMSALSVNDSVDFNYLKDLLEITDGNLASNIKALEKADYIKVEKIFIGKKPNTRYIITSLGKIALRKHVEALEKILKEL